MREDEVVDVVGGAAAADRFRLVGALQAAGIEVVAVAEPAAMQVVGPVAVLAEEGEGAGDAAGVMALLAFDDAQGLRRLEGADGTAENRELVAFDVDLDDRQ